MFSKEPLSIGGVLDAGFRLYANTFAGTLPAALVGALPGVAASLLMFSALDLEALGSAEASDMAQFGPTFFAGYFLNFIGLVFLILAVTQRQYMLGTGQETSLTADLLRALKLTIPITVGLFVYMVLVLFGMVLLIIPGLIIAVSMGLYMQLPVMEGGGAWKSLLRSHRLVWGGNWVRTAVVVTVGVIALMAISGLFTLLLGGLTGFSAFLEPTAPPWWQYVLGAVLNAVIYPIPTAINLALAHDLKLRKEGDDLESRLKDME